MVVQRDQEEGIPQESSHSPHKHAVETSGCYTLGWRATTLTMQLMTATLKQKPLTKGSMYV
jgi:hypothetical protein